MVMFDNIEDLFQELRDFNDHSKALVTFATAFGALVLFIYILRFLYNLSQGVRLYVISQWPCCQSNYIERYGKWAVISGSTDGIGLGIAKEFARRGHSILVIGRNEVKLAKTKELLKGIENVGEVETVKIDLSDSSLENFERIREQIDPDNRDIGILVNNAGVFVDKMNRFNEHSLESIKNIVIVNVLSLSLLTRILLPSLVEKGRGLVVNVSSIAGCITSPYMSVYGPSKSFVDSFSKLLQDEYGSRIDVVNLHPGGVATKLYRNTRTNNNKAEYFVPTADYYSKVTTNALSTRIKAYSGTLGHGITLTIFKSLTSFGIPLFKHLIKLVEPIKEIPPIKIKDN